MFVLLIRMPLTLLLQKEIFEPCVNEHPVVIHHGKTRETTQGLFQHLGLHNELYPRLGVNAG